MTGTVKRLVMDRGFGFVKDGQTGVEYFFHRSGVQGNFEDLREGDPVTFEQAASQAKGPRAEKVMVTK